MEEYKHFDVNTGRKEEAGDGVRLDRKTGAKAKGPYLFINLMSIYYISSIILCLEEFRVQISSYRTNDR